jgi:hypothetical protein
MCLVKKKAKNAFYTEGSPFEFEINELSCILPFFTIIINHSMAVEINFKDHAESKIVHLIALLRSMDFIENVKITPDVPVNVPQSRFDKYNGVWKNKPSIEKVDGQLNTLRNESEVSFFDQFYGSIPELDVTEFETYLNESRNEWERPLS